MTILAQAAEKAREAVAEKATEKTTPAERKDDAKARETVPSAVLAPKSVQGSAVVNPVTGSSKAVSSLAASKTLLSATKPVSLLQGKISAPPKPTSATITTPPKAT
jgi:hypothetical protein